MSRTFSEFGGSSRGNSRQRLVKFIRVFFAGLAILALSPFVRSQDDVKLPEGNGKEIVQKACSMCHGLQQIADSRRSHDEWKDLVQEMIDNGAQLQEDEVAIVIDYLAKNFPKDSPPTGSAASASTKINVNKASAKDLQNTLALSDKEASAIVDYRGKNGPFGSVADLEKVPGLDTKKIEDKKDLVTFTDDSAADDSK